MKQVYLFGIWLLGSLGIYSAQAQVYPIQATTQLIPPYSVYLSDYAQPGVEKLRVILLQRDLSQGTYQLRLVFSLKRNGQLIARSSPAYQPPALSLDAGIPTLISGLDLAEYLDSRHLDFVGYSKEQYERTRALPEGNYEICFTAYDYRRPEVQVSNEACSFYYLAKNEPPLVNLPACGAQIALRSPQQIIFSWLPRNTASPNSAAETEYLLQLYEVRPAGRNLNDVVLSSRPVYEALSEYTQLIYGAGEPPLLEGMQYAWRVQARDRSGKDAFRNQGFSEVCSFTMSKNDPEFTLDVVKAFQVEVLGERKARMYWNLDKDTFESYRIYYKKVGQGYEWFSNETSLGELRVFDLEPNTAYEARLQGGKQGVWGDYTALIRFHTLAIQAVACGDKPAPFPLANGSKPLLFASPGTIVEARGLDLTLENVQTLGDGYYRGTGRVSVPYLAGASYGVRFERLYIDEDRRVGTGRIDFITEGIQAMTLRQTTEQEMRRKERQQAENRAKYQDLPMYEQVFAYDNIEIQSLQLDNEGNVQISDNQGKSYTNVKIKEVWAEAKDADKAVIIQDKKGNQWLIKKDGKVEKVEGGGLPPVDWSKIAKDDLDIIKKAMKALRKEYNIEKIRQLKAEYIKTDNQLDNKASLNPQTNPDFAPSDSVVVGFFLEKKEISSQITELDNEANLRIQALKALQLAQILYFWADDLRKKEELAWLISGLKIKGQIVLDYLATQKQTGTAESVLVENCKNAMVEFVKEYINASFQKD